MVNNKFYKSQDVFVAKNINEEGKKMLPTNHDGTLSLKTVAVSFPNVIGLEYKSTTNGFFRQLLMDSDETFFFEPVDGWKDKTFIVICSPDDPIPEIVQMKKDIRRMDKHIKELDDRIYSAIIDSKNRKYQENQQQKTIFNKIITKNQNNSKNKELEKLQENIKEENLIIKTDDKNEEKNKENVGVNKNNDENLNLISPKIDDVFITFCLNIHLHEGLNLEVHDTCGSSDPYIKCKYAGKTIYKSEIIFKELNPKWDEEFSFLIQDPTEIITFKVFDYDRFMRDDFMGTANISLSTLNLSQKTQFKLKLEDQKMQEINIRPLGYLIVSITLTPITEEQRELVKF
ncbi:hypothetical protein ACQ4LE_000243 [Meloidogyne hapla]